MDSKNYLDSIKELPENVYEINHNMVNDGISVIYSKELEFRSGEFNHTLTISLEYDFITECVTYYFEPDQSFNGVEVLNFFIRQCNLGIPNPDSEEDRAEVAIVKNSKVTELTAVISEYFKVVRGALSTFSTCLEYARNSNALRNLPRSDYKFVSIISLEHDPVRSIITASQDYLIDDSEFGITHHLGSVIQKTIFEDGKLGRLTKLLIADVEDQDYSFYRNKPNSVDYMTDLAVANLNLDFHDGVVYDNRYYDTRHGTIYADSDSGQNLAFFTAVKAVELVPVEVKANVNFIGRDVSDSVLSHFSAQYFVEDAPEYMVVYYV